MSAYVKTWWNPAPLKLGIARAQSLAVRAVAENATANCEWRHVRSSIHVFSQGNLSVVGSTERDAQFLEKGTRPHRIDPVTGGPSKVLRFASGDFVSGPVDHPGTAAKPFLAPAAKKYPAFFNAAARATLPHPRP